MLENAKQQRKQWQKALLERRKAAGAGPAPETSEPVPPKVDLPVWAQPNQLSSSKTQITNTSSVDSARQKYEARKGLGSSREQMILPKASRPVNERPVQNSPQSTPRLQPAYQEADSAPPSPPPWQKDVISLRKSNDFLLRTGNTPDETPSWVKPVSTDTEAGIDWNSRLVQPSTTPTANKELTPEEIQNLPLWQQKLIQPKNIENKDSHSTARRAYEERKGIPLEPIQPGRPAWRQRIDQSRARRESNPSNSHEKRLIGNRKERQVFLQAHLEAPAELIQVPSEEDTSTHIGITLPFPSRRKPPPLSQPIVTVISESLPKPVRESEGKGKKSWENHYRDSHTTRQKQKDETASRRKQRAEEISAPIDVKLDFRISVTETEETISLPPVEIPHLEIEENIELRLKEISFQDENFLAGDLKMDDIGDFVTPKIVIPRFVKPEPPPPPAPEPEPVPEAPKVKQTESELRKLIEAEEKMVKKGPAKEGFKKTAWHEQYKALGVVNQIMARDHFTLEDLLEENESTLLVAGSPKDNKKLMAVLGTQENLIKLLNYAWEEPVLASSVPPEEHPALLKRLKITEACLQIMLQTSALLNKITKSQECLRLIFQVAKTTKYYVVFARFVQLAMILFMLDTKSVCTHLAQERGFMEALISKVGTQEALSEDILMVIRLIVKASKKSPEITEWFLAANVPLLLISKLAPTQPSTTHEESAHILGEILAELKMNEDGEDTKKSDAEMSPIGLGIVAQFRDETNIDLLFSYAKESPSSLIHILNLFETVLEADIEGEDSMILLKVIDNISTFLDYLVPVENNAKHVTTSTGSYPSFGFLRLAVLNFVLVLVVEEPDFGYILIDHGFYPLVLEMFFDYPTNNVVHDVVLQFFLLLSSRDEDEIMEVFVSTNLLDRIGGVWEEFFQSNQPGNRDRDIPLSVTHGKAIRTTPDGQKKESYPAYFGHLAILANMISDMIEETPALNELIKMSDKWQQFLQPHIDNYNMAMINMTSTS